MSINVQKQQIQVKQIINNEDNDKDKNKIITTNSFRFQEYVKYFNINQKQKLQPIKNILIHFLPSDIQYHPDTQFTRKMTAKIIKYTKDYIFIDIEVQLGYFKFKNITIAHFQNQSPTHNISSYDSGCFCTVYRCKCRGQSLAFKCFSKIKFNKNQVINLALVKAVQEYCMLKLASYANAAPKYKKGLGYDIMVYSTCIQFCMQVGKPFSQKYQQKFEQISSQLKQSLLKLHSLGLIHHDIKRQNICFSQNLNRYVFIDFGMSRIIKQQVGQKSLTRFRGTLTHCSDEMFEIFSQEDLRSNLIDIYYNDMIGLKKILQQLQTNEYEQDYRIFWKKRKYEDNNEIQIIEHHQMQLIKYAIFQNNYKYINSILQSMSIKYLREIQLCIKKTIKTSQFNILYYQINKILKNRQQTPIKSRKNTFVRLYVYDKIDESVINNYYSTFLDLNAINKHSIISYFSNSILDNTQYLHSLLQNSDYIDIINERQYLYLLSKAIQFNSNNLSLFHLDQICKVSLNRFQLFQKVSKYRIRQTQQKRFYYFYLMNQYLLNLCLEYKFKGVYLLIFINIINNICTFMIIAPSQLIQYYNKIINLRISFECKYEVLVTFYQSLSWIYHLFDISVYYQIEDGIELINDRYLLQPHSEYEYKYYRLLLDKKTKINLGNIVLIDQFIHLSLVLRLKLLYCSQLIKNYIFSDQIFQNMRQCYQYLKISNHYIQYYYIYFLVFYLYKKQQTHFQQLMSKCMDYSHKLQKDMPILHILSIIYELRKNQYKPIQYFCHEITQYTQSSHPFQNYLITSQINRILRKFHREVIQYVSKIQKKLLNMQFETYQKIFKTNTIESYNYKYVGQILCIHTMQRIYPYDLDIKYNIKQIYKQSILKGRRIIRQCSQQSKLILGSYCLFLLAIFIKRQQYQLAYELSLKLLKIGPYLKIQLYQKINLLQVILKDILFYILMNNGSKKIQYRHIYQQYYRIIHQNNLYLRLIQRTALFIQLFIYLCQFGRQKLVQMINNLSRVLVTYNNRSNCQKYIEGYQYIFRRIIINRNLSNLLFLDRQLQIYNNPYNILPLFFMYSEFSKNQTNIQILMKVFTALPYIDIFTRQYILRSYLFRFIGFYYPSIHFRHQMKVFKMIVNLSWFNLHRNDYMRLVLSDKSIRLLNKHQNRLKLETIKQIIDKLNNCIYNNSSEYSKTNFKVLIGYGTILLKK